MAKKKRRENYGFYFDYSLLFVLIFIMGFGLTMIYSTSSYTAQINFGSSEYYFKRQLIFSTLGLGIMAFTARFINYKLLKKLSPFMFVGSIVTLFLLLIPALSISSHGATRWVGVGGLSFQPAEIVKIGSIVFTAALIDYNKDKFKDFRYVILVTTITGVLPAILIYLISDNLSSAIIVLGISFVMTFVASNSVKIYVGFASALGAAVLVLIQFVKTQAAKGGYTGSFRFNRLIVWLNPESDMSGKGYQTVQALYAIGSGGIFGKGLGKSLQKLGYIPESQNDMIFSVICEELGLFGATCLIILFGIMIWRIVHISQNAPDLFGSLLAVGVFAHIAIQVILNIAVVTNLFPNTGVSLPFVSYGGSSAFFLLFEMGIVFNISSKIKLER